MGEDIVLATNTEGDFHQICIYGISELIMIFCCWGIAIIIIVLLFIFKDWFFSKSILPAIISKILMVLIPISIIGGSKVVIDNYSEKNDNKFLNKLKKRIDKYFKT